MIKTTNKQIQTERILEKHFEFLFYLRKYFPSEQNVGATNLGQASITQETQGICVVRSKGSLRFVKKFEHEKFEHEKFEYDKFETGKFEIIKLRLAIKFALVIKIEVGNQV